MQLCLREQDPGEKPKTIECCWSEEEEEARLRPSALALAVPGEIGG